MCQLCWQNLSHEIAEIIETANYNTYFIKMFRSVRSSLWNENIKKKKVMTGVYSSTLTSDQENEPRYLLWALRVLFQANLIAKFNYSVCETRLWWRDKVFAVEGTKSFANFSPTICLSGACHVANRISHFDQTRPIFRDPNWMILQGEVPLRRSLDRLTVVSVQSPGCSVFSNRSRGPDLSTVSQKPANLWKVSSTFIYSRQCVIYTSAVYTFGYYYYFFCYQPEEILCVRSSSKFASRAKVGEFW